jgi:hypothetical protein
MKNNAITHIARVLRMLFWITSVLASVNAAQCVGGARVHNLSVPDL